MKMKDWVEKPDGFLKFNDYEVLKDLGRIAMYYWNRDNFKGLKDIGEKYCNIYGYEAFASYCFLKEKGLKKEALKAINEFISSTKCMSIEEQRRIADEIISLSYHNKDIHQLISHPLMQFLLEVFKNWAEEVSEDVIPYRWLGYISNDLENYEKALEINPTDEISIIMLVQASLSHIDYQTHHLSETRFIGKIEDARNSLEKADELINKLQPGQLKDKMLDEYRYFLSLINRWEEYKQEQRTLSFTEWCKSKGEHFKFWSIVYYNK